MRDSNFVRSVCALLAILSANAVSIEVCNAVTFLPIYGGPTYSQTTGGYIAVGLEQPGEGTSLILLPSYSTVNNAGVAVGNLLRADTPFSSTLENVYPSVAIWSATSSPVILNSGSSTTGAGAFDINNAGIVVGSTELGLAYQIAETSSSANTSVDSTHEAYTAAQWNAPATNLTNLNGISPSMPNNIDTAVSINSQGTAVGSVTKFNSSGVSQGSQPVSWAPGSTTAVPLGTLSGDPNTQSSGFAFAINNSGTIVGKSTAKLGGIATTEAVRWETSSSAPTMLGNLGTPAGQNTAGAALTLNGSGTAVGYVTKFNSSGTSLGTRAVRWDASGATATELGNLGTDANGVTQSYALAINDAGTVIGNAELNGLTGTNYAVRWDAGITAAVQLGSISTTPTGAPASTSAAAINSSGLIVGSANVIIVLQSFPGLPPITTTSPHAVYWTPTGTAVDLNSLIDPNSGWVLTQATAISDTDWIAGVGMFDPDGAGSQAAYQRLFLMQVPEPSSLLLIGLGAVCLVWNVARKVPAWQKPA